MSDKRVEDFRNLYKAGAIKKEQIDAMYEAGKITKAQYEYILSE